MEMLNRELGLRIRPALDSDVPILNKWDSEPHVIQATTDSDVASVAFSEDHDWHEELDSQNEFSQFFIAEVKGQPIGALQVIDPYHEATHYWGNIEENLRAIDIWIGEKDYLGKGFGTEIMTLIINFCFAQKGVTAIVIDPFFSNKRAHQFYQRLGFVPTERRLFNNEDDCLVHRLEKKDWKTSKRQALSHP